MRRFGLCLVLFLGLFSVMTPAQINTGKITGFVTDPSGAVIARVPVTATNAGTGVMTKAETSDSGEYLLNFLVPGTYRVEVEKVGFQRAVQNEVVVSAGGTARIDVALVVGSLGQTVEVEVNELRVSTETSELSQTFSNRDLSTLPNLDRNPLFQMNLIPGANNDVGSGNYMTNGGENGSAIGQSRPQLASIGGVDANANSIYIDGVPNREPQNAYISLTPAIEGVQEVQVYTGKYNAEFGFSGSAVVNISTKSGTNEFHGAAFEYLRNDAADARNFFAQPGVSTPFRRNQFGGAVGGPVLKNKLFFFGDYQGTLATTSSPHTTTVPTAKMLTGDFSELYVPGLKDNAGNEFGQIYDPFTRTFDTSGNVTFAKPFPGNIIPQNRWDAAANLMNTAQIFGLPNLPGFSNNLAYLDINKQAAHQADGRLDFNRTSRDRLFFRYSVLDSTGDFSTNVNKFFQDGNADSKTLNQNMQVSDLFTISPSLMNEARLAYNRTNCVGCVWGLFDNWNNMFGIPNGNLAADAATKGLAEIILNTGAHGVAQPDWVAYIVSNTIGFTDNFTWIKGKHLMKFGTNLNHVQDVSADTIGGDDPRGNIQFNEAMTSYDGVGCDTTISGFNPSTCGGVDPITKKPIPLPVQPSAYTSFLLGTMSSSTRTRFQLGAPIQSYWQNAWYAQDDFKVLPSLTLNIGLRYELLSRPVERHNRQSNWDVRTNQLVVATSSDRSPALGLDTNDWGPRVGFAWTPDHGKTSIRGGYGISYWMTYWTGPLTILGTTYPFYAKQSFLTPNNLTPTLQLSNQGIPLATADTSGNSPIPGGVTIRGAEHDWKNQRVDQANLNIEREIRPGILVDLGYLHVRGIHNNHSVNINQAPPTPKGTDYNTLRPLYGQYPQLADIPISESIADSWYDAITARFAANIGKSITINSSYAHGRNFANGNNLDQTRINQFYGPTQQDIAHIFNTQFRVELPVGRGRHFLGDSNCFVNALLGGWEFSGFLHIRSGARFDVTTTDGTSLNNNQNNRPDRIANGQLSHPTVSQWFDTSAFVLHATAMTYGNSGINPLHSDGMQQLDSSLSKTFHLTERQQLQFRVDAFNTFNHPNFNAPDSVGCAAGVCAVIGDATEAQVTSTSIDNRRMQFSLRYSF